MSKVSGYIILLLSLVASAALVSCNSSEKKLNERVSLWRKDKIPYGTYVAYENLKYIFPDAYINTNKTAPYYINDSYTDSIDIEEDSSSMEDINAYIIIASRVNPSMDETLGLLSRASKGEHVFISASNVGVELLDSLHLQITSTYLYENKDTTIHSIYDPVSHELKGFTYPGIMSDNYFSKIDTTITTILGTNSKGKANFVKFDYKKGGSFIVNLSPFAFTNFFLLHKQNNDYYNKALSYLPAKTTFLEWDDYFRSKDSDRSNSFSSLGFLMKQKAFRWAIILVLILSAILFLIESKRRQQLLPLRPPLKNSSLDFVNTIGRLYFQQKDHKNLARKMIIHFLEQVRSKYNIPTSLLDNTFIEKLAYKGNFDKEELADLVADINQIDINTSITESELFMFSQKLEKFK